MKPESRHLDHGSVAGRLAFSVGAVVLLVLAAPRTTRAELPMDTSPCRFDVLPAMGSSVPANVPAISFWLFAGGNDAGGTVAQLSVRLTRTADNADVAVTAESDFFRPGWVLLRPMAELQQGSYVLTMVCGASTITMTTFTATAPAQLPTALAPLTIQSMTRSDDWADKTTCTMHAGSVHVTASLPADIVPFAAVVELQMERAPAAPVPLWIGAGGLLQLGAPCADGAGPIWVTGRVVGATSMTSAKVDISSACPSPATWPIEGCVPTAGTDAGAQNPGAEPRGGCRIAGTQAMSGLVAMLAALLLFRRRSRV